MSNRTSPWSGPQVAAFFDTHPDRVPRVASFVPGGWDKPVADALVALRELEQRTGVSIGIAQIKAKFGQLRIYVDVDEVSAGPLEIVSETAASTHLRSAAVPGSVREQAHAIVDSAARQAEGCCIRCGAPAVLQQGFNHFCAAHRQRGSR